MSNKKLYKTMKVFDCQTGMPKDVKEAFFDLHADPAVGNDVFVQWTVEWDEEDYDADDEWSAKIRLVDKWLMANGARGRNIENHEYEGELVLIKHWW
jgi:hypothetical protein